MPSDDFMAGLMVGFLLAVWVFAIVFQKWMHSRHVETMAVYDRARDLLSDNFNLFREVHGDAMRALSEKDTPHD